MMNFVETHSYIVCEVPSFHGELKMNLPPLFAKPICLHWHVFAICSQLQRIHKDYPNHS